MTNEYNWDELPITDTLHVKREIEAWRRAQAAIELRNRKSAAFARQYIKAKKLGIKGYGNVKVHQSNI